MDNIDIKKVVKSKNPPLARIGFLMSYLKRIVHQDELNGFLAEFSDLPPIEFIQAALGRMEISYHTEGMDKLPQNGRYIFASNHPFGGMDGLMLADEVVKHLGDVRVVVNDLLMNMTPISPIFIPVNKHGSQNAHYAKLYNEAFESDLPIITFPAGLCSRRTKGEVADLVWRPNFVKRAILSKRDIVPVYFEGELSKRFYCIANLRIRLGIKANVEMLLLVDEMYRQKGEHFKIRIGDPVSWQSLEGKSAAKSTLEIREKVYSLKKRYKKAIM